MGWTKENHSLGFHEAGRLHAASGHMVSFLIRTHVGEAADEPAWRERTDPRDYCSIQSTVEYASQ